MSRDFRVKCVVEPRKTLGFSVSKCQVIARKNLEGKFSFPCTHEEAVRTLQRSSKLRIEIEPNVLKGVKTFYVGKDLPTTLVIGFPNEREYFSSWKTLVSCVRDNSKELVSFEGLRQRQFVDERRSEDIHSLLTASPGHLARNQQ